MNIAVSSASLIRFTMLLTLLINASIARADETAAFAAFDRMNAFDIEAARIAVEKAEAQAVRDLGRMIIDDHVPIQKEARRIAAKLGIEPAGINADDTNTLASLKAASGSAFDQAYLAHERPFSKEFIRTLKEDIVPAISNKELKSFLQDLVPKFEMHLMHIEHTAMSLQGGHGAGHNPMQSQH